MTREALCEDILKMIQEERILMGVAKISPQIFQLPRDLSIYPDMWIINAHNWMCRNHAKFLVVLDIWDQQEPKLWEQDFNATELGVYRTDHIDSLKEACRSWKRALRVEERPALFLARRRHEFKKALASEKIKKLAGSKRPAIGNLGSDGPSAGAGN